MLKRDALSNNTVYQEMLKGGKEEGFTSSRHGRQEDSSGGAGDQTASRTVCVCECVCVCD